LAMSESIMESKKFCAAPPPILLKRGTHSGKFRISNGSMRPTVARSREIADAISFASRPRPSEKIVRPRTSSESHFMLNVGDLPLAQTLEPGNQFLGCSIERGRKAGDNFRLEQGRERASLDPPIVTFRFEEAVPQARPKKALLQRILTVIRRVVDEHPADCLRVADNCDLAQDAVADGNRQFEMGLGPGLDRIAPQDPYGRQRAKRGIEGHGCGRARQIGRAGCHDYPLYMLWKLPEFQMLSMLIFWALWSSLFGTAAVGFRITWKARC
jgi:hypothetical protein